MKDTTPSQDVTTQESQKLQEWQKWQAEHRALREAKGYVETVTDEEVLDILGLL
jgi:hypothetical protein